MSLSAVFTVIGANVAEPMQWCLESGLPEGLKSTSEIDVGSSLRTVVSPDSCCF